MCVFKLEYSDFAKPIGSVRVLSLSVGFVLLEFTPLSVLGKDNLQPKSIPFQFKA